MRAWIERQRNLLDFTIAALARRKGKNLALISVYTAVVALLASASFSPGPEEEAKTVLREAPEIVVQRHRPGGTTSFPSNTRSDQADQRRGLCEQASLGVLLHGGANYTLMTGRALLTKTEAWPSGGVSPETFRSPKGFPRLSRPPGYAVQF